MSEDNILIVEGMAWDSPYPGFFHATSLAYPIVGEEGRWEVMIDGNLGKRPVFGTQAMAMRASRDLKSRDIEKYRKLVEEYDAAVKATGGNGAKSNDGS